MKMNLTAAYAVFSFLLIFNCWSESFQSPDNYFDRIAMVSDGRITRFTNLPITVYVEGLDMMELSLSEYADDVRYAMKEWEDCSNRMLKFQLVNQPDGANILVSWVTVLDLREQEHPLGIAELQRKGQLALFHVEMRICLREKTGKPLTQEQMRTTLLHEFGHAIGLWGHSKDKADVMYYAADALHPTVRDANTLKMLYSRENNYPLYEQSIKAIKEDMESKPDDAELYFLLGTVCASQEKYSEAIDNLKKCLNLDPEFYKASSALAHTYKTSGQDQAALAQYLSLAESDPAAWVYNLIGAMYFEKEDIEKAIQYFRKALMLDRAYEPAKKNIYQVYLSKGKDLVNDNRYDEAISFLVEGITFFPDKPELRNALGIAYNGVGRFQEAISQYVEALRINPAFMPARSNLAACYNNQGVRYAQASQWEQAVQSYNKALKLIPDMAEAQKNVRAAYWNRAVELSKSGRDREAIEAYRQFLEIEPDNKEAHNNLGAAYFRTGNFDAAIAEFSSALKLDPGDNNLRDNLAISYHKRGVAFLESKAYHQSAAEFEKGLKVSPDNVNLHLALAQVYQRLEKWGDATQHITTTLELDPDNTTARKILTNLHIQQGNSYLNAKKYDQALECYNKVPADLMPASLHNSIGYLYIMKKMYLEAIDEFDKVLNSDPQDKVAHQNLLSIESTFSKDAANSPLLARARLSLAMSYKGRGDLVKAKSVLKSAIDLNPQDRNLRHLLAEGCVELAEAFTNKYQRSEARELTDWAAQLE